MSIASVVLGGYGNGTVVGSIAEVSLAGYTQKMAINFFSSQVHQVDFIDGTTPANSISINTIILSGEQPTQTKLFNSFNGDHIGNLVNLPVGEEYVLVLDDT